MSTSTSSNASSLSLSGKVAIVTGSSRNIGACIATKLAEEGAYVVVNYQSNSSAAQALVQHINEHTPGKAVAIQGDMGVLEDGRRLVEEGVRAFGAGQGASQPKLDILCLNAGLMGSGNLEKVTEEDFDKHFNINVKVPLFMTQQAAKYMSAGAYLDFTDSAQAVRVGGWPNFSAKASRASYNAVTR